MNRSFFITCLSLVLVAVSGASLRAADAGPAVIDDGHFFTSDTVRHAEDLIAQIHQKHGKDVVVQTFDSIPPDLRERYEREGRSVFFEEWLRTLARKRNVNGVFILICRQPAHLQVQAGSATRAKAFPNADRDELVKRTADAFRANKFDSGLLLALETIDERMDANLGNSGAPGGGQPTTAPSPTAAPAAPPATTEPDLNK